MKNLIVLALFVFALSLFTVSDTTAQDNGFGSDVAIFGDTAIVGADDEDVGANGNQGAAYIFVRSGGVWKQQAKLTASDGAKEDYFGRNVAIAGDTVIISANFKSVDAKEEQGAAYVFVRSGTKWTEQAKLTASDGAERDEFGVSVGISGDTIIVGTYSHNYGRGIQSGAAYIFTRSGKKWTQQAKLTASEGSIYKAFGFSVGISGDTVIVGTATDKIGENNTQGSAYIFTRSEGKWTEQAKLTAPDGAKEDYFGWSVGISGDTAIVGMCNGDSDKTLKRGAAYIFVRSGKIWSQQQKLTAPDGKTNDDFGFSVDVSGNMVIVGARVDDIDAKVDQGSAYIFVRSGTVWKQQAQLTASNGGAKDRFGYNIAISGDQVVVSANYSSFRTNTYKSSAYVFTLSGIVWKQQQLTPLRQRVR